VASLKRWSTRHANGLEALYRRFEAGFVALNPLWRRFGFERAEGPVVAVEQAAKGLLFDCRMCGQCALSATGMTCSMVCPKNLRNGPCGGVRQDGHCEVDPDMVCVWTEAWTGAQTMRDGVARICEAQPPLDWRLAGRSSWLAVARRAAGTN